LYFFAFLFFTKNFTFQKKPVLINALID